MVDSIGNTVSLGDTVAHFGRSGVKLRKVVRLSLIERLDFRGERKTRTSLTVQDSRGYGYFTNIKKNFVVVKKIGE